MRYIVNCCSIWAKTAVLHRRCNATCALMLRQKKTLHHVYIHNRFSSNISIDTNHQLAFWMTNHLARDRCVEWDVKQWHLLLSFNIQIVFVTCSRWHWTYAVYILYSWTAVERLARKTTCTAPGSITPETLPASLYRQRAAICWRLQTLADHESKTRISVRSRRSSFRAKPINRSLSYIRRSWLTASPFHRQSR